MAAKKKVKARNKPGAAASGKAKGKAAAKKGKRAAQKAQITAEFDSGIAYHPPKEKVKKRNTGRSLAKTLKSVLFGGTK